MMGTFEEVKKELMEAIGVAMYGIMAIHDYTQAEMRDVFNSIIKEAEFPVDFIRTSCQKAKEAK